MLRHLGQQTTACSLRQHQIRTVEYRKPARYDPKCSTQPCSTIQEHMSQSGALPDFASTLNGLSVWAPVFPDTRNRYIPYSYLQSDGMVCDQLRSSMQRVQVRHSLASISLSTRQQSLWCRKRVSPCQPYARSVAYRRHFGLSSIPAVLLPPTVFCGLLVTLWTYKCLMMVIFQNKIIYVGCPTLQNLDQEDRIASF